MKSAVVDTSAILALTDESYEEHSALAEFVALGSHSLIVTPFVVAEADYMLASRLGPEAALRFNQDVVRGSFQIAAWDSNSHALAISVCEQLKGGYIGIADAANVVAALAADTVVLLTLDQRHFRSLKPLGCDSAFTLVPYDAL